MLVRRLAEVHKPGYLTVNYQGHPEDVLNVTVSLEFILQELPQFAT
jgi:hypothetical protein